MPYYNRKGNKFKKIMSNFPGESKKVSDFRGEEKTFPWGKGDRREAVVDEGKGSTVLPECWANTQHSTARTVREKRSLQSGDRWCGVGRGLAPAAFAENAGENGPSCRSLPPSKPSALPPPSQREADGHDKSCPYEPYNGGAP